MEKVKVKINVYSTFGGEDFPPGEHLVSEEAAKSFVEKKLGSIVGEAAQPTETSTVLVIDDDLFRPVEAVEKYLEGDSSDKVFASLKAHQPEIIEFAKGEIENFHARSAQLNSVAVKEVQKVEAEAVSVEVKPETEDQKVAESQKVNGVQTEEKPLPDDFPSLAKFKKLGFKTVDEVQEVTKEQLVSLGISEATADKALAFGK